MGALYQTAFYGLPSDVPVVGVWRESVGNADPACTIQITATPIATFTPMPNPCKVIVKPNTTAYFRHQPFLDDRSAVDPNGENWLFSYDGVTVLASARPWLWQTGQLPQVIDVNTMLAVSVAQIAWDLPNDLWLQVRVPIVTNGIAAEVWAWTTTQEVNLADPTGCPLVNVPRPDANMPIVAAGQFIPATHDAIFVGLPPSVIGSCGFHDGRQANCAEFLPTQTPVFTTIDLMPRNIELCIDTRNKISGRSSECDPYISRAGTPNPTPLISVRSPATGCVLRSSVDPSTVLLFMQTSNANIISNCNGTH